MNIDNLKSQQSKYYVPIFNVNYIGENESLQLMWKNGNVINNLKDYIIDSEYQIILKRFSEVINWKNLNIYVLSEYDIDRLLQAHWYFEFECDKEKEEEYKRRLNLFLLAARITLQSDLSIEYMLCINCPIYSTKYLYKWNYAIAEIREKRDQQELNKFDLDKVVVIYNRLQEFFKASPRTAHAVNFLFLAYTSYYWMASFMLLMTALETLVSPDEIGGIVSKVSARVLSLINDKSVCSKAKFDKIYTLRSDIIHGKVLADINFDKNLPKLQQLQKITLAVFKILLEKDFKNIYQNEELKEGFFRELSLIEDK